MFPVGISRHPQRSLSTLSSTREIVTRTRFFDKVGYHDLSSLFLAYATPHPHFVRDLRPPLSRCNAQPCRPATLVGLFTVRFFTHSLLRFILKNRTGRRLHHNVLRSLSSSRRFSRPPLISPYLVVWSTLRYFSCV